MTALPSVSHIDTPRNRFAIWLANHCLRLASPDYRAFIKNSIRLGIEEAVRQSLQRGIDQAARGELVERDDLLGP